MDSRISAKTAGQAAVDASPTRQKFAHTGKMLICFGWLIAAANAVTIDFESIPSGTIFGGMAGDQPGDVVYAQQGVNMSVEDFFLGSYTGFVKAEVGGKYDPFFSSTPLGMENISILFDFTGMGGANSLTLEYQQFGGADNFSVNGGTMYEPDTFAELPTNIAPGVTAFITNSHIILTGNLTSVRIGGQELAIDNVTAVPEPATILLFGIGALFLARKVRSRPVA